MRAEPQQGLGSAPGSETPTPLTDYTFTIREALYQLLPDGRRNHELLASALAALDRLAGALERAGRERDEARRHSPHPVGDWFALERERDEWKGAAKGFPSSWSELWAMEQDRAEAAERERDDALGERVVAQLDIAQARAEKAERALAEMWEALEYIIALDHPKNGTWANLMDLATRRARAALRPSEDTSDES